MAIPEPMLSTRAAAWPAQGDWMMEPKWDGFCWWRSASTEERALGRAEARVSGNRLDSLLAPLAGSPRGTVFDAELVALSTRDGRAVRDFAAVCRATLQADAAAARKLHVVAFDLLHLSGEDVRPLPWGGAPRFCDRPSPGERLRLIQTRPASRAAHDQLVALGFEGSVLKRPGSTYRPGRQTTWRKYKASHRAAATLRDVRRGRDGHAYAIADLHGRRVTTLGSPRLAALIGQQVELTYSRVDADGSLREVRISASVGARRLMRVADHAPQPPAANPAERPPRSRPLPARGEAEVRLRRGASGAPCVAGKQD